MFGGGGAAFRSYASIWMQANCRQAAYRMLSAPILGKRPCGGRTDAFPLFVVVCAMLLRRTRAAAPN